ALRPYLAAEVLTRSLGRALNTPPAKMQALASLAGQSLTADPVVKAVRGDGPIAPLEQLIAAIRPLAVAFGAPPWTDDAITYVSNHAAAFGADPLPHMVPDASHPNAPFLSIGQLRA